jgi:D-aminopeptidase
VSLDGSTITDQSSGEATVKLTCTGIGACAGKVTLSGKSTSTKGKKAKTETIGTAAFSISPGKTATIKLTLNAAGKALLSADHGRLGATLSILKSSPAPSQTHTASVHLVRQKTHGETKK